MHSGIYQLKTDPTMQKVSLRIVPVWHQRCTCESQGIWY